jgi:hypothetical protein
MKPIGAEEFPVLSKNSLFRPKNSLFFQAQGIGVQTIGAAA